MLGGTNGTCQSRLESTRPQTLDPRVTFTCAPGTGDQGPGSSSSPQDPLLSLLFAPVNPPQTTVRSHFAAREMWGSSEGFFMLTSVWLERNDQFFRFYILSANQISVLVLFKQWVNYIILCLNTILNFIWICYLTY